MPDIQETFVRGRMRKCFRSLAYQRLEDYNCIETLYNNTMI